MKQDAFGITLSPTHFCNDNWREKKIRPIHKSVLKSWKPQLRWLECEAFPLLQSMWLYLLAKGQKQI